MRKAKIRSEITIKVNIGNFEHLEVTKEIETEVEFEKPDEMMAKSAKIDAAVAVACKNAVEVAMSEMGRKRYVKPGLTDKEVPLWKDSK